MLKFFILFTIVVFVIDAVDMMPVANFCVTYYTAICGKRILIHSQ